MRVPRTGWAGGLALALWAPLCWAQDVKKEAADLFRAGTAAYERHEYRAAALAFEEAYRRVPRGAVLYNAGLAWEEAGELPRAADAYATAIEDQALDEPSRSDASLRLATLGRSVGSVRVAEPVGEPVAVGHVQRAIIPVTVHLLPGSYEVRLLDQEGRDPVKAIVITAGHSSVVTFEGPHPPAREFPSEQVAAAPSGTTRWLGWVGIASAVAFSGAAIGLGIATVQARDQFDATGDTDAGARSRAITLRLLTNVAWGAAAVTGVTGVVFLLTAPRAAAPPATSAGPIELRIGLGTADCLLHF